MRLNLIRRLLVAYFALSVAAVLPEAVFAFVAPGLVTAQSAIRTVIVAGFSVLTLVIANRALRGDRKALLRLRIIVPIVAVACVVVLFFLPLPLWVVVEQVVCCIALVVAGVLLFTERGARGVVSRAIDQTR